jgi:hypothetical protein
MSHAVEILKNRARSDRPEQGTFARHFSDFTELSIEATAHYFVCSFSSDSEELGQWRAYADNGRGYALGFDGKELVDAFIGGSTTLNPMTWVRSTFEPTYNDGELRKIHGQLIDAMFDLISLPRGRDLDQNSINEFMKTLPMNEECPLVHDIAGPVHRYCPLAAEVPLIAMGDPIGRYLQLTCQLRRTHLKCCELLGEALAGVNCITRHKALLQG